MDYIFTTMTEIDFIVQIVNINEGEILMGINRELHF